MAFCTSCGAQVADGTAFCPTCGKPMAAAAPPAAASPAPSGAAQSPTAGMQENVAGLLCYVIGWVTGIIFLLIDKRPFVRFHAAQSIVVFGAISVLYWIMAQFLYSLFLSGGWALFSLLFLIVRIGTLVLWILLMVKAYQGERYRIPFAADFADSLAGKVKTV